jgi:hypothetical protein
MIVVCARESPTFGHHLHEITKAEFVAQIPAHAEDDYFAIEMAAFEEFVHVEHSSALSFEQSAIHISAVERAGMRDLKDGQKIADEIVANKRTGKSSADNLKPV